MGGGGGGRRYRVCSALRFALMVHLNSDVLHLQVWPHVARDSSVPSQLGLSGDSLASLIQRTLVSGDTCEHHGRGVGSSWHPVGGARDAVSPPLCPRGALQRVTRPGIRSGGRKLVWAHTPPGIRWCRRAQSRSTGGQTLGLLCPGQPCLKLPGVLCPELGTLWQEGSRTFWTVESQEKGAQPARGLEVCASRKPLVLGGGTSWSPG